MADLVGPMKVADVAEKRRFELPVGDQLALLNYRLEGDTITLIHTEVPASLAGRGLGSILARAALESARERGLKVRPTCPFVRDFLLRHPEYADLVVG